MLVQVVKSKIHRVKVTGADLNYIGSITIDEDLMDAANIIEGEHVINFGQWFARAIIAKEARSTKQVLGKAGLFGA